MPKILGVKKLIIILAWLVEESAEVENQEIERKVTEELTKGLPRIPWVKDVMKVVVVGL